MIDMPFDAVARAREVARDLVSDEGFVSHLYRGCIDDGGPEVTLHYSGRRRFSADSHMLFSGAPARVAQPEPREPLGTLRFLFERRQRDGKGDSDADIRLSDAFMTKGDARGITFAPHVDAVLPLEHTMDAQLQRLRSHGMRKKMHGLMRKGVAWRLTNESVDFDHFYQHMYLPTVAARFGLQGAVGSREELETAFRRGGALLFSCGEDGTPQSAALLATAPHRPGMLHYWKAGIANCATLSPSELTERYARVEVALLQYAVTQGYRELHLGVTRAVATDGVFIHKKRLGCTFQRNQVYLDSELRVKTPLRARLFTSRPVFVWSGPRMSCWVGHQGELRTDADVKGLTELLANCVLPELHSMSLFTSGVNTTRSVLVDAVARVQEACGCSIEIVPEA